jgi:parallel beta-helix repeat protein
MNNDVAAPEPERVPYGWPSLAIGLRPQPGLPCTGNRIEGNTIDGHTDGVIIGVLPPDGPGGVCSGNTILNNTIRMRPVTHSKDAGPLAGTPAVGVPIRLLNLQAAVGSGAVVFPMPSPPGGWPAQFAQAAVRENTIEGNLIEGAKGVAIELVYASGNRVANNRIGAVTPLTAAEHATLTSGMTFGIGPGFWLKLGGWDSANGTGIWLSEGSEGNTVAENAVAEAPQPR